MIFMRSTETSDAVIIWLHTCTQTIVLFIHDANKATQLNFGCSSVRFN